MIEIETIKSCRSEWKVLLNYDLCKIQKMLNANIYFKGTNQGMLNKQAVSNTFSVW
jgi:prolyl oligopeptidase PreP (S9A serine peptidase family)